MLNVIVAVLAIQSQPLTLEQSAMPLPQILDRIGGMTGQKLECGELYQQDVMVLKCRQEPVDDVLAKIAELLDGRWSAIAGGKRLVPDEAAQKRRRDAWLKSETDRFAEGLAQAKLEEKFDRLHVLGLFDQMNEIATIADSAKRQAALDKMRFASPDRRLYVKLARMIGPSTLAALPMDKNTYFSTHPSSLQMQLPEGAMAGIRQYIQESRLVQELKKDHEVKGTDYFIQGDLASFIEQEGLVEPAVGMVRAFRHPNGVMLQLLTYDAKGKSLLRFTSGLTVPILGTAELQALYAQAPIEGSVRLSPAAMEWDAHVRRTSAKQTAPTESVRQALMGRRDILSFAASEILLGAGASLGRSVMAVLPENGAFISFPNPQVPLGSGLRAVNGPGPAGLKVEDKWLIYSPANLDVARQDRIPRAGLANAATHILGQSRAELPVSVSLDLLRGCQSETAGRNALGLLAPLVGVMDPTRPVCGSIPPLLFISRLSKAQQSELLREREIRINYEELPAEAKEWAWAIMEKCPGFSDTKVSLSRPSEWNGPGNFGVGMGASNNTITNLPSWTMAQPDALPAILQIRALRADTFAQRATTGFNEGFEGRITLRDIARREAMMRAENAAGTLVYNRHALYALDSLQGFSINFLLGERYESYVSTYLALTPGVQQFRGLSEFSESEKREFEKLVQEEAAKLPKGNG